ncbi:MAG: mercuric ion transporter MerT [Betaproteobacteria bacterium]|nr:mercuric ion transporter MerT [Betaproteobacteria bacterium]
MTAPKQPIALLAAGGLAALLGSACCLGPLVLVSVGLGGAWLANLQAFEPLRPYLLGAAIVLLFLAYRRIWRPVEQCTPGQVCALPKTRRTYKAIFGVAAALLLAALASPYLAPYFY